MYIQSHRSWKISQYLLFEIDTSPYFVDFMLNQWKSVRSQAMPQQMFHLSYYFYFSLGPANTNNCLFSTKILQGKTSRQSKGERNREGGRRENLGSKGFEDASRVAFVVVSLSSPSLCFLVFAAGSCQQTVGLCWRGWVCTSLVRWIHRKGNFQNVKWISSIWHDFRWSDVSAAI